jgi:uncharacterized membrane protein YesL
VDILNSKIYRIGEVIINLILLDLLWLLACLPVVTAFPATAAMFGVVRDWIKDSDTDSGVVLPFGHHLKANFAQGLWLGFVWLAVGCVLVIDFVVIEGMEAWLKAPLFVLLALVTLCLILASVYLFPVMVNYEGRWVNVIKNAFLIAIIQPGTTIPCILVVAVAFFVVYYAPVSALIVGSGTAYLLYLLCRRAFDRIEVLKGISLETTQKSRPLR